VQSPAAVTIIATATASLAATSTTSTPVPVRSALPATTSDENAVAGTLNPLAVAAMLEIGIDIH